MSRDPREPSGWWGEPGRPDPDDRRRSDSDSQSFLGLQLWQQIVAGLAVAAIIAIIGFLYHHAQHPEAGKSGSSHNSIPISSNGPSSSTQPAGDVPTLPDQAGYNSRWQQSIIIDNNGVIFQQAGPVSAAGTYGADLTYYDGSGWGGTESDLSLWLSHGVPTPTECVGNNSGYTGIGTLVENGDRYCFINNQSPNGPIVISLEVTRIQTDSTKGVTSVTLDASAWAPR